MNIFGLEHLNVLFDGRHIICCHFLRIQRNAGYTSFKQKVP